jgi:hypothetical protein
MSESTPSPGTPAPEPAAAEAEAKAGKPAPRRCNWHRVRVYSLSIILMVEMWFCGVFVEIRLEPLRMANRLLAQLPYPSSAGRAFWINRRTLELDNVRIGDFFRADAIVITASPLRLARHHLAKVQVFGAQLFTRELTEALKESPQRHADPRNGFDKLYDATLGLITGYGDNGLDWIVGRVEIARSTILLDNLVEDTSIPIGLGVRNPLVLNNLHLGRPDASPEMTQERTVEISSVNITSPFDPLAHVFVFPLTRVTFSYAEVWRHHITRIDMIEPTIYLGEDLFWLTQQLQAQKPPAKTGVDAPWYISELKVDYGRLAVSVFGQPVVHFPFFIETKVKDIRFDQLNQISVKSSINIEKLTQDYPDYKVSINNLRGKVYISWPPTNVHANNVVNSIQIDEISWNKIPVTKVNANVTFDPTGIYGKFSGACAGGELSANFEFYYTDGFKWNADFFAQKVNCQPVTQKLAGKYCDLTGELDGRIEVQGKATQILKCNGLLQLPNAGVLKIKAMEDLIKELPPDANALERQALQLVINSFDVYPYVNGKLTLNYSPAGGASELRLDGPLGSRSFQVAFHPSTLSSPAPEKKE